TISRRSFKMNWIRELAKKHTFEVFPELYEQTIKKYDTVNGYTYATAFDALNIAHSNGVNIASGLENGTLRLITANERYALINLKKDEEKMTTLSVYLNESQIMELVEHVEINDYVEFMTMDEWNDLMTGESAIEIIESIDMDNFDTGDEYAVLAGSGYWNSSDDLEVILEPFLGDMLQEYLDNTLQ